MWQTPLEKDPFKIPLDDKAELLLAVSERLRKVKGVRFTRGWFSTHLEWKLFASTDGAFIEQSQTRVGPGYAVTAVDDKSGEFESRAGTARPCRPAGSTSRRAASSRRPRESARRRSRSSRRRR